MTPEISEGITPENLGKYAERRSNGEAARLLQDNPILKDILTQLKNGANSALIAEPPASPAAMRYHYSLQAIVWLEQEIKNRINMGEEAARTMAEATSQQQQEAEASIYRHWIAPPIAQEA